MWNRKSQKEIRDDSVISTISLNIDVYILDSGKSDVNQTKKDWITQCVLPICTPWIYRQRLPNNLIFEHYHFIGFYSGLFRMWDAFGENIHITYAHTQDSLISGFQEIQYVPSRHYPNNTYTGYENTSKMNYWKISLILTSLHLYYTKCLIVIVHLQWICLNDEQNCNLRTMHICRTLCTI